MTNELTLNDLPQPEEETTVHPDELSVDGTNPNEQSDEMFGLLCENMRTKGWLGNDIVCDTEYVIADGEHRWRAAQEIGLEEVPVKVYDIDDPTRRLWRQELNKISGEHDTKRDALEYDYLLNSGKSEAVTDLADATDEDLDELLAEIRVDQSTPPAYEYDPDHNVYFEDCVEGMHERLDENSVDMVFTSPPYNVEKTQGQTRSSETVDYEDSMSGDEYRSFLQDVFQEAVRVLKPNGHLFINHHVKYSGEEVNPNLWIRELVPLPFRGLIVWHKDRGSPMAFTVDNGQFYPSWEPVFHFTKSTEPLTKPNGKTLSNVWDIPSVSPSERTGEHPAPYPTELPQRAIQATTSPGDLILDPFMGSGTTAVAAIESRRSYVGFELDEAGAYKPIIERRIGEAKRATEAGVNQESTGAESDD